MAHLITKTKHLHVYLLLEQIERTPFFKFIWGGRGGREGERGRGRRGEEEGGGRKGGRGSRQVSGGGAGSERAREP